MGERIARLDWTRSGLGAPHEWPRSLQVAVGLMLRTPQPASIAWGDEMTFLYNDAHAPICGDRHPRALGQPAAQVWADIWEQLGPINAACLGGEALFLQDVPFALADRAAPGYFSFSYTPLQDDDGTVRGLYCVAQETTATVRAAQRQADALAAQHALQERDEQLRLATEAADLGFWSLDLRTGAFACSGPAFDCLELQAAGHLTWPGLLARLDPTDSARLQQAFERACDAGARALLHVEVRTTASALGRFHWLSFQGRAAFDDDGTCVRVLGTCSDITARRTAEQAMEVALEASRTGTFRWDIAADRLWWDSALDRLFGLQPGQAVHTLQQFLDLVHADDRAAVIEACRRCREHADDFELEFRVVHPDGSVHWLYDRGRTFLDAQGRATAMTGACVDVTERRRAEAALQASERFHRRTLACIPAMTFGAAEDGHCDYLSEHWAQYTGIPAQQLLGNDWWKALHPDDRERASATWERAVATGEPYSQEYRLRRHDGTFEWFQSHGVRLPAEPDMPARWLGSVHAVGELKSAQAALQERERELRAMADNSPDIIARLDRQHRHVFVNAAAERLTGIPLAAFRGRTSRELGLPAESCERWERSVEKVFTERRPVGIQFDLPHAGGARHYSARLVPEIDAQGDIATVLAVTRDITEAAQAQEALRRADRQKDEFLATLAHELRNPLAPVRTGFGVLQRGERTREERRVLDIMDRQLTHLVRLVDELLDIARIGQGKVLLRREVLPLAAVLEQAVDACRPLAEANGHMLTVETADPSWMVHGDLTRLVQVVSNLLTNACKYTPKGGHVRLWAEPQGEELCIVVEDDGLGIPAEALASIFDRFVQVQQHQERAQGGLGIGLSVVRSLVEMHGGRVTAESGGPGLGSRFKVWLGRVADTRPLPFTAQEPSAATLVKRTVLIVDDNADAAETLAMLVELQGHEAIVAAGGEEALRLAAARSPHIALVDLGMPGMDGLEVARRMRILPGGTGFTLVALTGRGTEEDRQRSRAAGFDLHVTKPIQVAHIEELLGARRG